MDCRWRRAKLLSSASRFTSASRTWRPVLTRREARVLKQLAFAGVVMAGFCVSFLSAAQENTAPPTDPLTQQIGAEMDRRAAEAAAAPGTATDRPDTGVDFRTSTLRSATALFLVVALILLVY